MGFSRPPSDRFQNQKRPAGSATVGTCEGDELRGEHTALLLKITENVG